MKQQFLVGSMQVFNKQVNTKGEYFVKMPSDLMNYVHVPKYRPELSYLYAVIVDYFNADLGYAYPTEWQISRRYGKSIKTVRRHLVELQSFGLVKITKVGRNNRYVPFKPLNKADLFEKCPAAETKYREELAKESAEYAREKVNAGNTATS